MPTAMVVVFAVSILTAVSAAVVRAMAVAGSDGTRESLSVYYDDSLFSEKSNKYNHRLAQYSLAMALAGLTQAPV